MKLKRMYQYTSKATASPLQNRPIVNLTNSVRSVRIDVLGMNIQVVLPAFAVSKIRETFLQRLRLTLGFVIHLYNLLLPMC